MTTNPLFDPKTDNQDIHEDSQKMINTSLASDDDYTPEEQAFVDMILRLVEEGKIQLFTKTKNAWKNILVTSLLSDV